VENPLLDGIDPRFPEQGSKHVKQQKPQPAQEEAEVVSGGCEHGVDGIAGTVCKIVSVHPVLCFQMPDDGSTAARRPVSRLVFGVMRRFWPAIKTRNL